MRIGSAGSGPPDNLGIGDRVTEFLLPEKSFAALKACSRATIGITCDRHDPAVPKSRLSMPRVRLGRRRNAAFYERIQGGGKSSIATAVVETSRPWPTETVARSTWASVLRAGAQFRGCPMPTRLRDELTTAVRDRSSRRSLLEIEPITFENKSHPDRPGSSRDGTALCAATGDILVRRGDQTDPARRDEIVRMVRGEAITPAHLPNLTCAEAESRADRLAGSDSSAPGTTSAREAPETGRSPCSRAMVSKSSRSRAERRAALHDA